jgi:hypothetical protein
VPRLRYPLLSEVDIEITMPGCPENTKEILVSPVCTNGLENIQQPALFSLEDEKCTAHVYRHIIDIFS